MNKIKEMSIGIDLGTTYCCVACLDEMGDPQIQKNADGEFETPAAVFIAPNGKADVGTSAKEKLPSYPERVIFDSKSAIGSEAEYIIDCERYTPVSFVEIILERIVKDFCRTHNMQIDEKPFIKKATVAVPAHFGHSERETILKAAETAGISKPEILDEPIAAAIGYGYGHSDGGHKRILIFDLGGGTTEVTVLDIDGKTFAPLSVESGRIGGLNFDGELKKIASSKIANISGIDIGTVECTSSIQSALDLTVETVKKELSTSEKASGSIVLNGKKIVFEITRREFEGRADYLMESAFEYIDRALEKASARADELDAFVLSGGSSRIPMVADGIRTRYPDVSVCVFEPSFAVAKGAAIYAGRDTNDVKVDAILSKTYGIKVNKDGKTVISNILYRNSHIPYESRKAFHPEAKGQTIVTVEIYEDDADRGVSHTDLEDASKVGVFNLKMPEGCDKDTRVSIRLCVSHDGTLSARAECGRNVGTYTISTSAPTSESGKKDNVTPDPSARAPRFRVRP